MMRGSVPTVNSRAQHTFSRAPQVNNPRSSFMRSHGVKTTFNEGYLVPIFVDEMVPGDTFMLRMHAFARIATLDFPIMDNLYLETFFFAVPNRLLWNNWEKFCGYQVNPGDSIDFTVPQIQMPAVTGAVENSLADYFGIPTKVPNLLVNSLHFRAYNLIWNDWFRSEDLQDSAVVDLDDGPDTYSDYTVLRRGKRYDYFTSCLPDPQKGPDVELPLGSIAPIVPDLSNPGVSNVPIFNVQGVGPDSKSSLFALAGVQTTNWDANGTLAAAQASWDYPGLNADLSSATAANINDIRLAVQTQRFLEKDQRGGTRYTEVIKSHFGVDSPDARLQRPEYIGGGSSPVVINPVAQTTPTSGSNALGSLGAYGICAPHGHGFTYSATEHMVLIGLVNVRADLNYQQGLNRMWSRQTRYDFYWPVFSHLGEQAVLNKEIYAQGTADDDLVFGYQERWAEYRYKASLITGLFRSNATNTLENWHLAQDFGSLPALNDEFIVEDAPMSRIKAIDTQPDFLLDCNFTFKAVRRMPLYSVPGLMDHL